MIKKWLLWRTLRRYFRCQYRYVQRLKDQDIDYNLVISSIEKEVEDNEARQIFLTTVDIVYKNDINEKIFLRGANEIINKIVDKVYP